MTQVFSALGWLIRTPKVWPAALVPTLVWTVLAALGTYASVRWLEPWLAGKLPDVGYGVEDAAAWLLTVLASLLGAWLALFLTPPLSGPALTQIVEAAERDLGAPARPEQSFFAELWSGLRSMVTGLLLVLPALALALLLDVFLPVLAPLSLLLKLLATALGLSWGLLDYPLALRGMRMRERLLLFRAYPGAVLGFGLALSPMFWLPCCAIVSLPTGVAAATFLYHRIASSRVGQQSETMLAPGA